MAKTLEYYFDYQSPYTYLADTQLAALVARTGAELVYKPVLLSGIMKEASNHPPGEVPAKAIYMLQDLGRWARRYGVPFTFNPAFPINSLRIMRGAVAAQLAGVFPAYHAAMFKAFWVDALNLADAAVAADVVTAAGLDAAQLFARAETPEVKEALKASTMESVARGAFGAPAFVVGDELFWGNDRLDFVEAALKSPAAV
jgi:2-hydroxychromene-2-carboxylate isomerase